MWGILYIKLLCVHRVQKRNHKLKSDKGWRSRKAKCSGKIHFYFALKGLNQQFCSKAFYNPRKIVKCLIHKHTMIWKSDDSPWVKNRNSFENLLWKSIYLRFCVNRANRSRYPRQYRVLPKQTPGITNGRGYCSSRMLMNIRILGTPTLAMNEKRIQVARITRSYVEVLSGNRLGCTAPAKSWTK